MAEQSPQPAEVQFVRLSPEEAEVLAHAPEAIADLGHVALDGVEVVGVTEQTGDIPAQLINMSNDPGTRINISGETGRTRANLEKYGTPEAALAQLENGETPEAKTLAELAEESGFTSVLKHYDQLSDTLQTGNKVMRADIDNVQDDLRRLQVALGNAADEGPLSGNYVRNHPQLARQLDDMTQALAARANTYTARAEEHGQEISVYSGKITGTSELVIHEMSRDSREARAFSSSLDDLQASLRQLALTSPSDAAAAIARQAASMLSNLTDDYHLTPDDARMMVMRISNEFDEVQHTLGVNRGDRITTEKISDMKRLIQKTA